MYTDEEATCLDEGFATALALLHSSKDDSADRLREMLDALIEKKHGFGRTLAARLPVNLLRIAKLPDDTGIEACSRQQAYDIAVERVEDQSAGSHKPENLPALVSNETKEDGPRTVDAEYEDYTDRGDIPRISIPDEGSADGVLCKICNGARLGPLILLECQECQEVYHPLCHQPPVVDVDVYDPRIVWRCEKCSDRLSEARNPDGDVLTIRGGSVRRAEQGCRKNGMNYGSQKSTEFVENSRPTFREEAAAKGSSEPWQRNGRAPTSGQLKQRARSKFSVRGTGTM